MPLEKDAGRWRTNFTATDEAGSQSKLLESLTPEELELLIAFENGDPEALRKIREMERAVFRHTPVSIEDWLKDPYYCGPDGAKLYPRLKQALIEIVNGSFSEVICTGGVGWGKSTLACMLARYIIYYLTCFQDPATAHGLGAGSVVTIALFSTKLKQIKYTTWVKLKAGIENTQYFKDCCNVRWPMTGTEAYINKNIQILASPTDSEAVIGTDLYMAIMDEVNFGRNTTAVEEKASINATSTFMTMGERIYLSIVKRVASRFSYRGHVSGKVVVISSKNDESDLTEKRVLAAKHTPSIYVADYLSHEIKPASTSSGKMMRVFFGGAHRKSRILADDEPDPPEIAGDEGAMVIHLPAEMRPAFEQDMVRSLRDLAGVSVPNYKHYFNESTKIDMIFDGRQDGHPFYSDEWICGDEKNVKWDEICSSKYERVAAGVIEKVFVPRINPDIPRHVHIDLSKKKDSTGLAIAHVASYVEIPFWDNDAQVMVKEVHPFIWIDFVLAINAPAGGEIDYDMIRSLLYEFKNHGFKFRLATADSYQSHDLLTQLRKKLCPAEELSMDRTIRPYEVLKAAVHQGRVSCYNYPRLKREISRLQYDAKRLKVDHPPNEGSKDGALESKDVSDAVAGVTMTLTEYARTGQSAVDPSMVMAMQNQQAAASPMDRFIDVQTGKPVPSPQVNNSPWWTANGGLPFLKG